MPKINIAKSKEITLKNIHLGKNIHLCDASDKVTTYSVDLVFSKKSTVYLELKNHFKEFESFMKKEIDKEGVIETQGFIDDFDKHIKNIGKGKLEAEKIIAITKEEEKLAYLVKNKDLSTLTVTRYKNFGMTPIYDLSSEIKMNISHNYLDYQALNKLKGAEVHVKIKLNMYYNMHVKHWIIKPVLGAILIYNHPDATNDEITSKIIASSMPSQSVSDFDDDFFSTEKNIRARANQII